MKNNLFAIILALFAGLNLNAQPGGEDANVVLEINGKPILREEFVSIYSKNNANPDFSKEAMDEYVELFINYKLKVEEAIELGLDTISKFKSELDGYRKQLAKPYLTDTTYRSKIIQKAYDRLQTEVRASHILKTFPSEVTPEDTLRLYNELLELKKRVEQGADFGKLALKNSDDPSVRVNAGDVGYFTSMQMVYNFEEAAFNAKIGDIVGPIKTKYGYHLIKVTDKRKNPGKVKVAHILVEVPNKVDDSTKNALKEKADAIYERVKNGESFSELAQKFSDDKLSAKAGGVLKPFGSGRMVEEFEEKAFSLKEVGEITEPFTTSYGYHIVKLLENIPIPSLEEMRTEIERRIKSDGRSNAAKKSFIEILKKEYKFKQDDKVVAKTLKYFDENLLEGKWEMPQKGNFDKQIAQYNGVRLSQKDFLEYVSEVQRPVGVKDLKEVSESYFTRFVGRELLDYEDSRLELKYPEFRALVKEYHDGILLFELTNQKVWEKGSKDTLGLQKFYEENIANYQWKDRLKVIVAKAEDEKLLKTVRKDLKKGKNLLDIEMDHNLDDKLNLRIEEKWLEKGSEELPKDLSWTNGKWLIKNNTGNDNTLFFVKGAIPAGPKKLEEIRGLVISDYQNHLEEEWIKELRAKYRVVVRNSVLYSLP